MAKGKTSQELSKTPTGIQGLDEITGGGLPSGRPTLVCGSAGCGKTLLAMNFIVQGALKYDEPGVFMSFEENEEELRKNFASLGFDLNDLSARNKISLNHVRIERSEIEETGEYDLGGLFIRLGHADLLDLNTPKRGGVSVSNTISGMNRQAKGIINSSHRHLQVNYMTWGAHAFIRKSSASLNQGNC